ncbi:hypothetical protein ACFQWA_18655 [Streptomyces thermogriseus]|uniref:hypothetical protein n=1 Tax=Streptomyces thermogriseus TaxID=75292 RepID=UPI00361984F8
MRTPLRLAMHRIRHRALIHRGLRDSPYGRQQGAANGSNNGSVIVIVIGDNNTVNGNGNGNGSGNVLT